MAKLGGDAGADLVGHLAAHRAEVGGLGFFLFGGEVEAAEEEFLGSGEEDAHASVGVPLLNGVRDVAESY